MIALGLLTPQFFVTSAHLTSADVRTIAPEVSAQFIRNMAHRNLIELPGHHDPQLFSFQNVIELEALRIVSTAGSSLNAGQLVAAAMAQRTIRRIQANTIGTDQDRRVMVYRITAPKVRPGAHGREILSLHHPWFCLPEQVPEALNHFWADEPGEARAIPADDIIEALVARYSQSL